jgi:hypothetical protein
MKPFTTSETIQFRGPDYAAAYAKLARHVAAADAHLTHNDTFNASKEIEAAMECIHLVENPMAVITPLTPTPRLR